MSDPAASTLTSTLAAARQRLLEARVAAGHWVGKLSPSALSTATASFALWTIDRHAGTDHDELITSGLRWLVEHQNADGGWGDTTLSRSNISTTTLCWAALRALTPASEPRPPGSSSNESRGTAPLRSRLVETIARAESWLARAVGSVEPSKLTHAVVGRYGADRTFSVPILTMACLAGCLGNRGWELIPHLPFEVAAFPQAVFRFVRLPVVSYALPALITMGYAHHQHRPSANPIARWMRNLVAARTLRVLRQIQPPSGGYLEAAPLTSFVLMSLAASGQAQNPVATSAAAFLRGNVRPDGAWPIDTNLATWVTTLSVNSLAADGQSAKHLSPEDRLRIRDWLLQQQCRTRHPYTGADPGGWAWTDLPGGVPDADDTAGALLALYNLGDITPQVVEAAAAGVRWLLGLQNRDGGIPTFCRGWGTLPFDRSTPELTAHALHAWAVWQPQLPASLTSRLRVTAQRALAYLQACQRADGAWIPLWFGNESAAAEENPVHGTARVLQGLCAAGTNPHLAGVSTRPMIQCGTQWLLAAQNTDGGWGGDKGINSSIEETAQAVMALAAAGADVSAVARGRCYLAERTELGTVFPAAPVGLYFARLWYYEQLYPVIGVVGALSARAAAG